MWIFKEITNRYCEKILNTYLIRAGEKTYQGYEAELLVIRNDFAKCLIKTIAKLEVTNKNDYNDYFKQVFTLINSTLKELTNTVKEYNLEKKTQFTTDLYETFFVSSLLEIFNVINELYHISPPVLLEIMDEKLFANNRDICWFNQFSFVLYEYILKKELDLIIDKGSRDIFDTKKQLVIKYIRKAADTHCSSNNENMSEYQSSMNILLQSMRSEEHNLQQRKASDINPVNSYGLGYLTQTFYKTSEKIMGKGQLGLEIDYLIKEYKERTVFENTLVCLQ